MAWNTAEPYVASTGAPVKVGVVKIGKTGRARGSITLSVKMREQLGDPSRCNVFIGDGDDAGQILIQCDDDGAHEFRELHTGGGKLVLNFLPGMPDAPIKPVGVRHEVSESDAKIALLTIHLPW